MTEHAFAVVLDAVASGVVRREQLFLARDRFELAFDRPWHGLCDADLDALLREMASTGALAVEKRHGATLLGITQHGGDVWERVMRVDWRRYNEAIYNRCNCIDAIRAASEDACERVVAALHAGGMQDTRARPAIRYRNAKWTWSGWKQLRGYYRIELDHPPLTLVEERRLTEVLRRARAGWKRALSAQAAAGFELAQ